MPSPHPTPSYQQEQNHRCCRCLPCRKRPYDNKDEDCCCCSTVFFTNGRTDHFSTNGRADHFPTNGRAEHHEDVVTSSCDNVSCVRRRKRTSQILTRRRRSVSSPPRTTSWNAISGLAFLLLIMMSSTIVVLAIPPAPPLLPSDSGVLHPSHNSNNNNPSSPTLRLAETTVIDVHESETYDLTHQTWVGGSPNNPSARWTTTLDDTVSLPPPSLKPPNEQLYEFTSDWKIDVTGRDRRDVYGWEYFVVEGVGVRRRRWLRSVGLREQRQQQQPLQQQQQQRQPSVSARSSASAASSSLQHKLPHREEKISRSQLKALSRKSDKRKRRKSTKAKTTTRPLLPIHQTLKSLRDNWNFKGYGWSIYKSFIFPSSFGLAFRIPLSINFDWYERHPGLPSFTSSFGAFYPFMVVCFFNVSLPLELIRFMFWEIVVRVWRIVYVGMVLGKVCIRGILAALILPIRVLWVVVRTLVMSTLFFRRKRGKGGDDNTVSAEASGKTDQTDETKESTTNSAIILFGHVIPPLPPRRPIRYSTDIQERLGMSISWRYSQKRGYEFRVSYWYAVLPTIIAWGDVLGKIWDILVPTDKELQPLMSKDESAQISVTAANSTSMEAPAVTESEDSTTAATATSIATTSTGRGGGGGGSNKGKGFFRDENAPLTDWLRRRTGSLGVSTGGPIPDYPHVSCSALLSLSGFYYGNNLFRRLRSGGSERNKRSTGATAFLPRRNEEEQEGDEGHLQQLGRHRDGRTKRTDTLSENKSGSNEMDNIVKETEEETEQELKEKEKRVGG